MVGETCFEHRRQAKKECNVYVLEEDWAANDDYSHDVDIFTDLNSAKISMLKQLKKEMKMAVFQIGKMMMII